MNRSQSPEAIFRRSTELLQAGDLDGWFELCADDIVFELPFAPPGRPARIEGLDKLADLMRRRAKRHTPPTVEHMQVYVTQDPDVIVAEVTVSGGDAPGGRERAAVTVATFRDGLISGWRDYLNPSDLAGGDVG
jgi:ketosteroid isomerase-like protein